MVRWMFFGMGMGLVFLVGGVVLLNVNADKKSVNKKNKLSQAPNTMKLTSSAFKDGAWMDKKYTIDDGAQNLSPDLKWENVPNGTESFALICDDPDAGQEPFVHWVLYNIPGDQRVLAENVSNVGMQGKNDFGDFGYGGPRPPRKHGVHHYIFTLYALKQKLDFGSNVEVTRDLVLEAMDGLILATGKLVGTYKRD